MNINELYEKIQDELSEDELNGEFLLHENVIIWSYNLSDDSEDVFIDDDYDDETYNFNASSSEELLFEGYQEDFDKFQIFLDGIGEYHNWTISESEIVDNTILFKIN